jgi:sulfotransferase
VTTETRFAFLAGLPRSGSTLLAALLNQRPDVYVSTNSPVAQIMWDTEQSVNRTQQYRANPKPTAAFDLVAQVMPTYHRDRTEALVIDKCRAWATPGNLRMLRTYVTPTPRIIVLTRPILEVLASFISLIHRNPPGSIFDRRLPESYRPIDDVRCDVLMGYGGDIDRGMWSIHNLRQPENDGLGHFCSYDELTGDTAAALASIEAFLGVEPFDYDLANIVNTEPEDDSVYGLAGMHEVRPRIERSSPRPEDVLSDYVLSKYGRI